MLTSLFLLFLVSLISLNLTNDPRQKVMKKVLITIALAGLAMHPENVLAGGSMSMCDGTKILC